jgi:hypothetical protein
MCIPLQSNLKWLFLSGCLFVKTQESLSGLFDNGEFYEKLCGHLVFIDIRQFLTTILDSLLLDVSWA